MAIPLPKEIEYALDQIHQRGFDAYIVGGCVRDALLGRRIHDYDITTNALPENIMSIFQDHNVIETGLKHGTVTVLVHHMPIEITTYRIDGLYTDHRHPDQVTFTSNLREDLRRRDFTINAMAYSPQSGVVDYFAGRQDIQNKLIRTVGSPDERFDEDPLRIMRALRFSAVLGFGIEEDTRKSIHAHKEKLARISAERIHAELGRMICGDYIEGVISEFWDVIDAIIPQSPVIRKADCSEINAKEPNVTFVGRVVANTPPVLHMRMAVLLHYAIQSKELSQCNEEEGQKEALLAKDILKKMRFDRETTKKVYTLIAHSGLEVNEDPKTIKRWMNKLTPEGLKDLIILKRAEALSHVPKDKERLTHLERVNTLLSQIIAQNSCYSLQGLAVNGQDLIDIGIPKGKAIGEILEQLLEEVIEEKAANQREELLNRAREIHGNDS